jgi:topoisomerase-4 subunit A
LGVPVNVGEAKLAFKFNETSTCEKLGFKFKEASTYVTADFKLREVSTCEKLGFKFNDASTYVTADFKLRDASTYVTSDFKFKEGDGPAFAFHTQTTDKILIATANGRFYTLGADKLPGARGFGEPVSTMIDMEAGNDIIAVFPAVADGRMLLAATTGKGFIARISDVIAETRKGRGVVTLKPGTRLKVVRLAPPETSDEAALRDQYVAVVGDNRKLVVFPMTEIPEMSKGQGVTLQRYKDGGLADAICFRMSEGLSWAMGGDSGRMRTENDMSLWRVARGAAGRLPPQGFPRNNQFD